MSGYEIWIDPDDGHEVRAAKCPACGKFPGRDFRTGTPFCCKYRAESVADWNQYAAAMELAEAAVWADECEEQRDYMDDTTSNRDAWRSIVNLDMEANDKAHDALGRVLEVFGV